MPIQAQQKLQGSGTPRHDLEDASWDASSPRDGIPGAAAPMSQKVANIVASALEGSGKEGLAMTTPRGRSVPQRQVKDWRFTRLGLNASHGGLAMGGFGGALSDSWPTASPPGGLSSPRRLGDGPAAAAVDATCGSLSSTLGSARGTHISGCGGWSNAFGLTPRRPQVRMEATTGITCTPRGVPPPLHLPGTAPARARDFAPASGGAPGV